MLKTLAIFTVTCGVIVLLIMSTVFKIVDRVFDGQSSDAAIAQRMRENLLNQTWIQENAQTDRTRIVETQTTERTKLVEGTKRQGQWLEWSLYVGMMFLAILLCAPLMFLLFSSMNRQQINIEGSKCEEELNPWA